MGLYGIQYISAERYPDGARCDPRHRARAARVVAAGARARRAQRRPAVRAADGWPKRPAQSVNELAARTHTHQSSVSTVVARLVERRTGAPCAGRHRPRAGVELALTAQGRRAAARRTRRRPGAADRGDRRSSPPRRRRQLAASLAEVARAMDGAERAPAMFFEERGRARAMAACITKPWTRSMRSATSPPRRGMLLISAARHRHRRRRRAARQGPARADRAASPTCSSSSALDTAPVSPADAHLGLRS